MHLRFLIISIIGFICLSLSAQEEKIIFRGKLINQNDGSAVRYAHIVITNKNVGLSSNIDGEFGIYTAINDSLKISAIGYETILFVINNSIDLDKLTVLEMIPLIYELETIEITPYLSYAELRDSILNYKLTPEEIQYKKIKKGLKKIINYSEIRGEHKPGILNPVSLLYSVFGKHAKYERMVKRLKQNSKIQDEIDRKYNPEIISILTDLKDKVRIKKFMDYCNFPVSYLRSVDAVELYKNLLIQYDAFLASEAMN